MGLTVVLLSRILIRIYLQFLRGTQKFPLTRIPKYQYLLNALKLVRWLLSFAESKKAKHMPHDKTSPSLTSPWSHLMVLFNFARNCTPTVRFCSLKGNQLTKCFTNFKGVRIFCSTKANFFVRFYQLTSGFIFPDPVRT